MSIARTSGGWAFTLWAIVAALLGMASVATAQPSPPTGLVATDGTFCDRVRLTWNASSGATQYTIWRSTVNNSGTALQIASTAATSYNDSSGAVLTTYWYWVKAVGASGTSGFSNGNDGFREGAPPTPGNVQASDGTLCGQIEVTWSPVIGVVTYNVFRNTVDNPGTATNLGVFGPPPFVDSNIATGTTYFYYIQAQNACNVSTLSIGDSGFSLAAPAAPTNTDASDGGFCEWTRVTWDGAAGATSYKVWRHTSNNPASAQVVGSTTQSPFDDFSGTPGVSYFYWVSSVGNCGESAKSNSNPGLRPATPSAVTGVTASNGTRCGFVRVDWNALPAPIGYVVLRNTVNNSATAATLGVVATNSYEDASATPGVTYWYWVRSVNSCGNGPFGTPDTGFRPAQPVTPTDVRATDGEFCDLIDVTWTPVTFASNYSVYRNTTNDPQGATLVAVVPSASYADTGISPSQTFWYWVSASGSCGLTPWSIPDQGSTGACGAGFRTGFEPSAYVGSPSGEILPGQDTWYNPVTGGEPMRIHTYTGNTLGIPANPVGSTQFGGGRRAGAGRSARAARDVSVVGGARWSLGLDFAAQFDGALPAQPDLGNFALLQGSAPQRGFRAFMVWDDPNAANRFSIVYDVYDANGAARSSSPGPEWEGLEVDRWYRSVTTLDYATNRILSVAMIDLTTGASIVRHPRDWYMLGGATPTGPRATAVWLAVTGGPPTVSGAGNIVAFDNVALAEPGIDAGFEPPIYAGSFLGVQTVGQDGWLDAGGGTLFKTLTHGANALGVVPDPRGASQFAAARWGGGAGSARIYRDMDMHASDRWTASFEIATRFDGVLPTAPVIGNSALVGGTTSRGLRVDMEWNDPGTAASWSATVRRYDASGVQTSELPAPAWGTLVPNRWYQVEVDLDFATNRYVRLKITDLQTQATTETYPADWYMFGGFGGATERATLVRLALNGAGVNGIGNIAAWDNVTVTELDPCPADCDSSSGFGTLDIFDFLCFQNLFATNDPGACECDTSTGLGVCDIFDFLCFQNAFAAGCP